MNILFISSGLRYYDSSASTRNQQLVMELAKYGHVYSIEFVHENAHPLVGLPLAKERLIVVKGVRRSANEAKTNKRSEFIRSYVRAIGRQLMRDVLFLYDFRKQLKMTINELNDYFDLVITTSDPVGIHWQYVRMSPRKLPQLRDANYWQYWGDPLYDDVNHAKQPWMFFIERYLLSKAEQVFWVSSATADDKKVFHKKISNKFSYLPRIMNAPTDLKDEITLDIRQSVKCIYAGDYFKRSRDIEPLIIALSQLPEHTLDIVGNGDMTITYSLNVKTHGRKSKIECDIMVDKADVVFVLANRNGSQVPGKIFELASTNKIVVILYESEKSVDCFPMKDRFTFCKNSSSEIVALFRQPSITQRHMIDEYAAGADLLKHSILQISKNTIKKVYNT